MLNVCFGFMSSWCNSYFLRLCFSNRHFFENFYLYLAFRKANTIEVRHGVGTSMALYSLGNPIFNFHFSLCIGHSANPLFNSHFSICSGLLANTLFNYQLCPFVLSTLSCFSIMKVMISIFFCIFAK